jgi:hypothetical protein
MIVQINTSGWSQDKINMVKAMVVKLLYDNGITHQGVNVIIPNIDISNPSGSIDFLTSQAISDAYDVWKSDMDSKVAAAQAEEQARETELQNNNLFNITLAQIDTAIDAITDLASAKVFLKKLARYVKARGL